MKRFLSIPLLVLAACEESPRPAAPEGPDPVSISICPNEATLDPPALDADPLAPSTVQFRALGGFEDLSTRDVTHEVTWASTRPDVVRIDETGFARALSPGSVSITATLGKAWSSASVTVNETPERTDRADRRSSGGETEPMSDERSDGAGTGI